MLKKASLFVDSHAGQNKDLAIVTSIEHDIANNMNQMAKKAEESNSALFNFTVTEDKERYEAKMIKLQQCTRETNTGRLKLAEENEMTALIYDSILEAKKNCAKAVADKEKAANKLAKAKPADKNACEAALKQATEVADKEVEKTEAFVKEKMKEALVNKYTAMAAFYKLALKEAEEELQVASTL